MGIGGTLGYPRKTPQCVAIWSSGIYCDFAPCVCMKEPTECLTTKVDKETCKVIEQTASTSSVGDRDARIFAAHARIPEPARDNKHAWMGL